MRSTKLLAVLALAVCSVTSHAGPFVIGEMTGSISYTTSSSNRAELFDRIVWSNDPVPVRSIVSGFNYIDNIGIQAMADVSNAGAPPVRDGGEVSTNFGLRSKVVSEGGQLDSAVTSASGVFLPNGTTASRFSLSARAVPASLRSEGYSRLRLTRAFVLPPFTTVIFTIAGQQSASIKVASGSNMSTQFSSWLGLLQRAPDGVYDRLSAYQVEDLQDHPSQPADYFVSTNRLLTLTYRNTTSSPVHLALVANAHVWTRTVPVP